MSGLKAQKQDKEEELSLGQMVIFTKDTGLTIRGQAKEEKLQQQEMSTMEIGKMIWKMDTESNVIYLVRITRVIMLAESSTVKEEQLQRNLNTMEIFKMVKKTA